MAYERNITGSRSTRNHRTTSFDSFHLPNKPGTEVRYETDPMSLGQGNAVLLTISVKLEPPTTITNRARDLFRLPVVLVEAKVQFDKIRYAFILSPPWVFL